MERLTEEQTLSKTIGQDFRKLFGDNDTYWIVEAMQAYADQQTDIAVQEALMMASEEAKVHLLVGECKKECEISAQLTARVDKQSILSLAPQIIEKLKTNPNEKEE